MTFCICIILLSVQSRWCHADSVTNCRWWTPSCRRRSSLCQTAFLSVHHWCWQ